GGLVQGIGQALMEHTVYDADGQLLTGSYMDYALPRAAAAPDFVTEHHPVPCKTNPLGTKGCGEAGCAGALVSIMNAIVDALSEYGIRHIEMPATPQRVWDAIQKAKGEQAAKRGGAAGSVGAMAVAIPHPADDLARSTAQDGPRRRASLRSPALNRCSWRPRRGFQRVPSPLQRLARLRRPAMRFHTAGRSSDVW